LVSGVFPGKNSQEPKKGSPYRTVEFLTQSVVLSKHIGSTTRVELFKVRNADCGILLLIPQSAFRNRQSKMGL